VAARRPRTGRHRPAAGGSAGAGAHIGRVRPLVGIGTRGRTRTRAYPGPRNSPVPWGASQTDASRRASGPSCSFHPSRSRYPTGSASPQPLVTVYVAHLAAGRAARDPAVVEGEGAPVVADAVARRAPRRGPSGSRTGRSGGRKRGDEQDGRGNEDRHPHRASVRQLSSSVKRRLARRRAWRAAWKARPYGPS
jgi:hypothetical protein